MVDGQIAGRQINAASRRIAAGRAVASRLTRAARGAIHAHGTASHVVHDVDVTQRHLPAINEQSAAQRHATAERPSFWALPPSMVTF